MTPEREDELYEAVLALVRETGYERLTLDAVAARAHVSKATLYRQWSGKATLVAHALKHSRQPIAETVDTGSLRGDFAAIVARFDDRPPDQAFIQTYIDAVVLPALGLTPESANRG